VVLFRDDAETTAKQLPLNAEHDPDRETLWASLERYQASTGGQALAIAHNGNLSNGRMFSTTRVDGTRFDIHYAAKRARWEPVYEVTQVKGDGETHPLLSPDDIWPDFETWNEGNVAGTAAKEPWRLAREYTRPALCPALPGSDTRRRPRADPGSRIQFSNLV